MSAVKFSPLNLARRIGGIASPAADQSNASSQASEATIEPGDIVHSGYLVKSPEKKKFSPVKMINLGAQEKKKFFVLTKNSLAYKLAEADAHFKEVYGSIASVELGPSPNALVVTVKPGEVIALTAATPDEAQAWLSSLQQVFTQPQPSPEALGSKPVPVVDEPTLHESQLGDESTQIEANVSAAAAEPSAVAEPVSEEPVPIAPTEPKPQASWFFAMCCSAE